MSSDAETLVVIHTRLRSLRQGLQILDEIEQAFLWQISTDIKTAHFLQEVASRDSMTGLRSLPGPDGVERNLSTERIRNHLELRSIALEKNLEFYCRYRFTRQIPTDATASWEDRISDVCAFLTARAETVENRILAWFQDMRHATTPAAESRRWLQHATYSEASEEIGALRRYFGFHEKTKAAASLAAFTLALHTAFRATWRPPQITDVSLTNNEDFQRREKWNQWIYCGLIAIYFNAIERVLESDNSEPRSRSLPEAALEEPSTRVTQGGESRPRPSTLTWTLGHRGEHRHRNEDPEIAQRLSGEISRRKARVVYQQRHGIRTGIERY